MLNDKSVESKVIQWLEDQGYPLEMAVAKAFRKSNFWVVQSDFYNDPETGKSREIDVVAHKTKFSELMHPLNLAITIGCCVECKLGRNKPWILFTSECQPKQRLDELTVSSDRGLKFLAKVCNQPEILSLKILQSQRLGYGITQAFTSGQDIPYQAVVGVAKSTTAKVIEYSEMIPAEWGLDLHFFFSAIVIDGPLFEAYLNNNHVTVSEIEFGTLIWNESIANRSHREIRIFTKSALNKLVQEIEEVGDVLVNCEKELIDVAQVFFKEKGYL